MKKNPFYKSISFAIQGFLYLIKSERNFQIEIFAFFINILLIYFLKLNVFDSIIILLLCGGILVSEIVNTAIEKICDYVQPNYDVRIKTIKDIASSAVLVFAIFSIFIGILVYKKYLIL